MKSNRYKFYDIQPKEGDIKLTNCEKIVLFCCLLAVFLSWCFSMRIAVFSSMRKDSEIAASRPFYWWYFWFGVIILFYQALGILAITGKQNNMCPFTCFFITTLFSITIDMIFILRITFVLIPQNIGSFLSLKCFKF